MTRTILKGTDLVLSAERAQGAPGPLVLTTFIVAAGLGGYLIGTGQDTG